MFSPQLIVFCFLFLFILYDGIFFFYDIYDLRYNKPVINKKY
jgi:hypothetical protein